MRHWSYQATVLKLPARWPYVTKTKASTFKGPAHITASKPTSTATSNTLPVSNISSTHHGVLSRGETVMSLQGDDPQSPQTAVPRRVVEESNQPQDESPSAVSITSVTSSFDGGYMERSAYIAPENLRAEDGSDFNYAVPAPSEVAQQIANLQNAFKYPSRAIRDSLFENFWTHCYHWDPIVDRSRVIGVESEKVSPLLLQTIFLAGSRMAPLSQSRLFAVPQEYYTRAKTLFWLDYEKDPWDLLARDCLISVAHGRPQATYLEDCDLPRPTLEDFPGNQMAGMFFIAYVDLSLLMGRFARHEVRKVSSRDSVTAIEDCLFRWAKNLPEQLHLSYSTAYNRQSRQLNILYLTTIILLYRSRTPDDPFPTAAVLAASTIAGIFEDFLARDEIRFLGPCFSFHLLAASITLLSCYKYPDLWALAHDQLKILTQAQEEMKDRWASALGSISSFDRMYKLTMATQKRLTGSPVSSLTPYQAGFFETCDMTLCRMYNTLVQKPQTLDQREQGDSFSRMADKSHMHTLPQSEITNEHLKAFAAASYQNQGDETNHMALLDQSDGADAMAFEQMFQDDADLYNGAMGNWLLCDLLPMEGM
ncbi:hypothetical protein B0A52_03836 [Exophiala mesophila]|uniref:Transcription factor domain-containing protein n=1 Tax=Exophiala mesophila TaxID=212818 RepID=A0A438N7D3_EXOME|nr:hypothetical protein B0A52_03836 [Exophiala mesophila]